MIYRENQQQSSSIIILGETGTGKSTFINNLCQMPKCKIGLGLDSETKEVMGINCEGEYKDIFMIDTPGLNDSNGEKQDERNINLMNNFIKNNPRIKGIIILLKFTDNKLTGSIKKSLKIFYDMFPMNNFWSHVIIIFSYYYDINQEEKINRKNKLIQNYEKEFKKIMLQSKLEHKDFIISEKLKMFFCELKNPDEETKTEIKRSIDYLKKKEEMFKKIEEKIEQPKIGEINKEGNVTIVEYYIEKITTFTDFDNTKNEVRKIIEKWKETFIEEKEVEIKEKKEGEKKIIEHYIYKKIRHKNKNNEEEMNIDKENPLEKYIEIEEMIYLPEEIDTKVEGNLTTYTHKFYKQMKYIDKNLNERFGKKILINSYITSKEEIEAEPIIINQGNIKLINYRKQNKNTDKDGIITYENPEIYKTDKHETKVEVVYVKNRGEDDEPKRKTDYDFKCNDNECIVCLEDYEHKKEVIFFPCSHMLHSDCARIWFKYSKNCPYCKYELTPEFIENIIKSGKDKDFCVIL